eukprot:365594-Chlamydomonas_euryale.AAC.13
MRGRAHAARLLHGRTCTCSQAAAWPDVHMQPGCCTASLLAIASARDMEEVEEAMSVIFCTCGRLPLAKLHTNCANRASTVLSSTAPSSYQLHTNCTGRASTLSSRGKRAVVVGRSNIVGMPAAMLLNKRDATVTLCHSRTDNIEEVGRGSIEGIGPRVRV